VKLPVLPTEPTLGDVQTYIKDMVSYRNFDDETLQDVFIMLTEEVGELAKSLRKFHGIARIATDSTVEAVEHEVADVLWMLICVCNKLDIRLEDALRAKEEINNKRTWR
jgi:NTP pyrophosphatase (non-canonical NTP hydrolase)